MASGHNQRSMVFQCQKLTDSVECSTRPARGGEKTKYFTQTLSRGLLCPPEASGRASSALSRAPAGRQNENMSEKFKRRKTISTF